MFSGGDTTTKLNEWMKIEWIIFNKVHLGEKTCMVIQLLLRHFIENAKYVAFMQPKKILNHNAGFFCVEKGSVLVMDRKMLENYLVCGGKSLNF